MVVTIEKKLVFAIGRTTFLPPKEHFYGTKYVRLWVKYVGEVGRGGVNYVNEVGG